MMSIAEPPPKYVDPNLDAGELYEVIEGVRVELPPMSNYATLVANEISQLVTAYAAPRRLGRCVVETLFRLPLQPERNRRPDVAFVSTARWPADRPFSFTDNAWDVVPDLAIEVISPTDRVEELTDKIFDYFAAGVRAVWVVHPLQKFVQGYDALTICRGLSEEDELDGREILPGFRINISSIFPPRQ
jgi:Uma2 family endonuclease